MAKQISENDRLELRSLENRVQEVLGQIDEAILKSHLKSGKETLTFCASELHKCADQLVWIITRLK